MTGGHAGSRLHPELGRRLLEAREEVLRRWEQRACEHLPAASQQSRLQLRDHLPAFVEDLAHELAYGVRAPRGAMARRGRSVGAARVGLSLLRSFRNPYGRRIVAPP